MRKRTCRCTQPLPGGRGVEESIVIARSVIGLSADFAKLGPGLTQRRHSASFVLARGELEDATKGDCAAGANVLLHVTLALAGLASASS